MRVLFKEEVPRILNFFGFGGRNQEYVLRALHRLHRDCIRRDDLNQWRLPGFANAILNDHHAQLVLWAPFKVVMRNG